MGTGDCWSHPPVKVRLGVEEEAAGGRRGGSTAAEGGKDVKSVQPAVCAHACVFTGYLVFPYEWPQFSAVSPPLSSVIKVTGFGDAPPHSSAVIFKLNFTWRFKT